MAEAPLKPTAAAAPLPEVELSAPAAAEDAPIVRYIGTYEFVGGFPEQQAVWKKIEGIASSFSIFAQGIVRGKLAESNQISKQIRIEADSETLAIYFGDRPESAPVDGTSVKRKAFTGEMMDTSFKISAESIDHTSLGKGKARVNTYRLTDDDTLVLHVSIKATQLPRELAYDLTYKRVALPKE